MANDDIIDVMGVNPITGFVELGVIDDKPWDDYRGHMNWLIGKLNLYTGYVFSGQINENPAYVGRPVRFVVYFNGRPPREARVAIRRVRDHLRNQQVELGVIETSDVTAGVDLDRWCENENE